MHVQVLQGLLAQDHEVPEVSEVRLERLHGSTAARDREAQRRLLAAHQHPGMQGHFEAIDPRRRPGLRQGNARCGARRGQVGAEHVPLTARREVRERPIAARRSDLRVDRPGAVARHRRMDVLVVREISTHDDQVHQLGRIDLEVTHRLEVESENAERDARWGRAGKPRRGELDRVAVGACPQAADVAHGEHAGHSAACVGATVVHSRHPAHAVAGGRSTAHRVRAAADQGGDRERADRESANVHLGLLWIEVACLPCKAE